MAKKQNYLYILGILAVLALIVFFGQKFAISGDTFVKPMWARLECSPTDTSEGSKIVNIDKDTSTFLTHQREGIVSCGINEYTDQCNAYIDLSQVSALNSWFGGVTYKAYDCPNTYNSLSECTQIDQKDIASSSISVGELTRAITVAQPIKTGRNLHVVLSTSFLQSPSGARIRVEYKPWKLYRYYGGAKDISKSSNCCFTDNLLNFIPNKEPVTNCLTFTGGRGSKWVNYVDDWAFGPATNVYTYQGRDVYCSGATLYDIATVETKTGQLYKINPNYNINNVPEEEKSYFKTLGNIIKNVECCPNEPNCGSDFKYKAEPIENKQCVSDIQCYNAGSPVPITSKSYVKYQCVKNTCIKSNTINVECTSNSACPNGQICDLSTINYGKCIQQTGGQFCGDNRCDKTESEESCPNDCKVQPPNNNLGVFILLGALVAGALIIIFGIKKKNKR